MRRIGLFVVLLWLCSHLAFAAVRVGLPIFNPPFVISKQEGFDTELIHLICSRLPDGCSYASMEYSQLYNELKADKLDIAIGGLTISTTGAGNYVYSTPYKLSVGQFVVLTTSTITSIDQLKGTNVGGLVNSTFEDYLANNFAGKFKISAYENMVQLVNALVNNSIQAVFIDQVIIEYWSAQMSGQFKLLGQPLVTGSGYAIVGSAKNLELIKQINAILFDLKKNGEFMRLYNAYFSS